MLVAQAVVNQVDGIYEIQANISFEPNWSINLIAPTIVPFETTTFNSTAGIVTIVPPSHRLDWNAAEFEEIQADVVAEAGEPVRAATSNQEQEGTKRLVRYGVPINESVFSQLTGLAKLVFDVNVAIFKVRLVFIKTLLKRGSFLLLVIPVWLHRLQVLSMFMVLILPKGPLRRLNSVGQRENCFCLQCF